MKRKVNASALRKWIEADENRISSLMQTTGLSFHTIDRMRRGKYPSSAGRSTRNLLCSATGLAEAVLFPIAVEKKTAS